MTTPPLLCKEPPGQSPGQPKPHAPGGRPGSHRNPRTIGPRRARTRASPTPPGTLGPAGPAEAPPPLNVTSPGAAPAARAARPGRSLRTAPSWGDSGRDKARRGQPDPPATWPQEQAGRARPGRGLGAAGRSSSRGAESEQRREAQRRPRGEGRAGRGEWAPAAGGARPPGPPAGPGRSAQRCRPRLARRRDPAPRPAVTCAAGRCCLVRAPEVQRRLPVPALAALRVGDGPEGSGALSRRLSLSWGAPLGQPRGGRRRGAARPWRAVPGPALAPAVAAPAAPRNGARASGRSQARARHGAAQRAAQGLSRDAAPDKAPRARARRLSRDVARGSGGSDARETWGEAGGAVTRFRALARARPVGRGGKVKGDPVTRAPSLGAAARPVCGRAWARASAPPGLELPGPGPSPGLWFPAGPAEPLLPRVVLSQPRPCTRGMSGLGGFAVETVAFFHFLSNVRVWLN